MGVPGFVAERSICEAATYGEWTAVHSMYQQSEGKVYPADYVDQACLSGCLQDCGSICVGGKAGCIAQCRADNAECTESCTFPGDPPGTGGNPCGSGTPCGGGCCSAGFTCGSVGGTAVCCPPGFPVACGGGSCCPASSVCSTVVGTTTTVCCPTAFPVARSVPFLGIRCFPF
jgi:hypothetical protein